jgi:hypothetical protein
MIKCQSRIIKRYKSRKAKCIWPLKHLLPNALKNPECDGDITVTVHVENVPDWGGTTAELHVQFECSNCEAAWFPDIQLFYDAPEDILASCVIHTYGKEYGEI